MRLRLGLMAHTFNPKTEKAKADKTGFCRFEANQHSEFLQASQGLHNETRLSKSKRKKVKRRAEEVILQRHCPKKV